MKHMVTGQLADMSTDIAVFVLKRDVKFQLTQFNLWTSQLADRAAHRVKSRSS